jgi:D-amino-acid dehydrogenase
VFPRHDGRPKRSVWTGLRPATPSDVPIGVKTNNLFLNTGMAPLGWTHSAAQVPRLPTSSAAVSHRTFAFTGTRRAHRSWCPWGGGHRLITRFVGSLGG